MEEEEEEEDGPTKETPDFLEGLDLELDRIAEVATAKAMAGLLAK